jgi:type IV pilus assembly protein PilE
MRCSALINAVGMKKMHTFSMQGFTLIESLVSAALMAILMGIALPSYELQWQINRRQDGQNALLQLHLKQLQWRGIHSEYASTLSELGWHGTTSSAGHFQLQLQNAGRQSYELHALAMGLQTRDTACANMSLRISANAQLLRTSQQSLTSDAGQCWRW